jgi:C-terminal processing protease CtpA/Prc
MYRPSTSDQTYYKEGDTAFLMYDQFGPINNKAWKEYYENGCQGETPAIDEEFPGDLSVVLDALKQASEDPEVKNLVVDLACNTGGDFDVLMAMSVLMGGPNYYYSENLVTGQRQIAYFDVDTNFDGVFDEKDKDVKYDLNIAVLTSDVSFSCGNFFPSMMQDVGFPIIGERSGGGSCAVHPFITPEGMQFQISSARARLTNDKWENIDTGIEPNYVVDTTDGYDAFYDVSAISDIINNHYNTDPTGILYVINRDDNHEYYDLFGRKLAGPPAKGIYIVDGKKVVK